MIDWNEIYSRDEFFYGREPNDFIRRFCKLIPEHGKVLELACGEGRNSVFLAKQGFSVDAIDSSRVAINKGKQLAQEAGVTVNFYCTDALSWNPDYKYDGVITTFFHAPPKKRQILYSRIKEFLKPHGIFLGEWFTPLQRLHKFTSGGPPFYEYMPTIEELKNNFKDGQIILLETEERVLHEGRGHRGPASLIHIIWRKY